MSKVGNFFRDLGNTLIAPIAQGAELITGKEFWNPTYRTKGFTAINQVLTKARIISFGIGKEMLIKQIGGAALGAISGAAGPSIAIESETATEEQAQQGTQSIIGTVVSWFSGAAESVKSSFSPSGQTTNTEKKIPVWALPVLVIAGIVVLLFLLFNKKRK